MMSDLLILIETFVSRIGACCVCVCNLEVRRHHVDFININRIDMCLILLILIESTYHLHHGNDYLSSDPCV